MKYPQKLAPILLFASLTGCVTLPPPGPSVAVVPAKGKPFDTFRSEDATCRQWAQSQTGNAVQEDYNQSVTTGAVAGTAVGAGLGAAIGSASGHAGAGLGIGALTGLLVGTAAGSSAGEVSGREAQRRYDNAYVQCMQTYGNQLPGRRMVAAPPAPVAEAPPAAVTTEPESYPPPPEVYVDQAPQFIYSPELNMYVAVGVPYDLVYTGNAYFYFYAGRWYRGPYYNGPWVYVPRRAYPPVFSRYRVDHIRHYRDFEYRRWQGDREHYGGRFYRPTFRGERRRFEERR